MHTWNTLCHRWMSHYTRVPMSDTPYTAGSSHNLLSQSPPHVSDRLREQFWEGGRGLGRPYEEFFHSNATDIVGSRPTHGDDGAEGS